MNLLPGQRTGLVLLAVLVLAPLASSRDARTTGASPLRTLDLTGYVNPFVGTSHNGNTWPGAVYPLGLVQWSPDTTSNPPGGYLYTDTTIKDFSLTHFSGRGCQYLQDVPMMPYIGPVVTSPVASPSTYYSSFSHHTEVARPGYYSVHLDTPDVRVELSATARTGYGRFTYPVSRTASLLIDAGGSYNGRDGDITSAVSITSRTEVTGQVTTLVGCGTGKYTLYFAAQFDHPFAQRGTWNGTMLSAGSTAASGTKTGAYVSFATATAPVVLVKVGLSYVSVANARANIAAENPNLSFATVASRAAAAWNARLNLIRVQGGTRAERTSFYTALYHNFLHPNLFDDANGQYMGFDGRVHRVPAGHHQYENIPAWDQYRCYSALRAILTPSEAGDIYQSLVNDARQGDGHLPLWTQANVDSYGMSGDGATPYIASGYAFGARAFDAAGALHAMIAGQPLLRVGLRDYLTLGYVSAAFSISASRTLEYAGADFSLAQLARALGDTAAYRTYAARAGNWENLFNRSGGYVQPRLSDGRWEPNFSPTGESGFEEGNAAIYTWMVPYQLPALFRDMGGTSTAVRRLDSYLRRPHLDNEPDFEIPWEYDFAHAAAHTQEAVRQAQLQLFNSGTGGLPGNDDGGAISTWYVLSAIGLYPEIPGVAGFAVGSPLFSAITVALAHGRTLTINAPAAADAHPYVQGLRLNGRPYAAAWLPWSRLKAGATLTFVLGPTASRWGN